MVEAAAEIGKERRSKLRHRGRGAHVGAEGVRENRLSTGGCVVVVGWLKNA